MKDYIRTFASATFAAKILTILARQSGNGGKECFALKSGEGIKGKKYTILEFLPEVWETKMAKLLGHNHSNPPSNRELQGWVKGYLKGANLKG